MTRILAFPKTEIAYNESLYAAIEARGIPVIDATFSGGWLWRNARAGDWAHLHWPSFHYAGEKRLLPLLWAFARFAALLLLIRIRGAKLAWTAHNLLPHDRSRIPSLDVLARRLVIRLSTFVFVHGPAASRIVVERFPEAASKVVVIPHGHWIGKYPTDKTKRQTRAELNLADEDFVFLFFGICKPYKNLELLVEAFRGLEREAVLVIAGNFHSQSYRERIIEMARGNPRIRVHPGLVQDWDVQTYLLACDAIVAPYSEVLTSGTAMLAMSFGHPLVSVDVGFLRDIVSKRTGILYPPTGKEALTRAMNELRETPFDSGEILAHARNYSFDDAANVCIESFAGRPRSVAWLSPSARRSMP